MLPSIMHSIVKKLQEVLELQLSEVPNHRIIAGVSGGADSVALLRALRSLQDELQLEVCVAHFDHQTRNGQSGEEAKSVEALSKQLQLPCFLGKACANGNPSEEAMRELRLRFLIETASENQAALICLAHHADDQAETILHHLIRGTGLQGMMGIPTSRSVSDNITLLHPMLKVRKSEILDYLVSINQTFCVDESNQDFRYTRNRIRHQLIPLLNDLNPQSETHLLQLSQQVTETYDYLQLNTEKLFQECVISIDSDLVRLHAKLLQEVPALIVRELFRFIWSKLQWPRKKMTFSHWEKLAQFVRNDQTQIDFPAAITARKRGEMIVLERKSQHG